MTENIILKYVEKLGRGKGAEELEELLKELEPNVVKKILEVAEICSKSGYSFEAFKKALMSYGIILVDINKVRELYEAIKLRMKAGKR